MSNIFDALQRAESESSGTESPRFSLATELLQAAERKMREAGAGQPQARVESSSPISAAELLQAAEQKMREADAAAAAGPRGDTRVHSCYRTAPSD